MLLSTRVVPEHAVSIARLTVRFCETDLMGIVHHANYLQYFEAARVTYLKRRGASYESWMQDGTHLAVAEAKVKYRKPARFDDALDIEVRLAEITRVTVRFVYVVRKNGEVCTEGETLLACVGIDLHPRRVPDPMANALMSAETHPDAS